MLSFDKLNEDSARSVLELKGIDSSTILSESLQSISLANLYAIANGRNINQATNKLQSGFGFIR